MMKIIFGILIFTFTLMFLPLDALCADHGHEHGKPDSGHHCVLVCHAGCHSAEIPVVPVVALSSEFSYQLPAFIFTYHNPPLSGFKRPPIRHS